MHLTWRSIRTQNLRSENNSASSFFSCCCSVSSRQSLNLWANCTQRKNDSATATVVQYDVPFDCRHLIRKSLLWNCHRFCDWTENIDAYRDRVQQSCKNLCTFRIKMIITFFCLKSDWIIRKKFCWTHLSIGCNLENILLSLPSLFDSHHCVFSMFCLLYEQQQQHSAPVNVWLISRTTSQTYTIFDLNFR